jgi:hypothetical protein
MQRRGIVEQSGRWNGQSARSWDTADFAVRGVGESLTNAPALSSTACSTRVMASAWWCCGASATSLVSGL